MKTFTALLLLSALTAYVSASEMEFHRAVFDFLDERHDEKMAQALRDQGFSKDALIASDHPEPPQWMVSKHILFYVHSKHSFLITFRFSRYGHAGLNLRPLSYTLSQTISYVPTNFSRIFFKSSLYYGMLVNTERDTMNLRPREINSHYLNLFDKESSINAISIYLYMAIGKF